MAVYFCKCGRQVNKSTNADNTGNRDTAQCTGCPYLLPWGPDKYVEGQGFHKDVQGYECRMSPTLCYTTTYRGQASDKCTLHILSLDLDFLDTVQAWIDDHAADTLSAGFSRGSMRGTDFSDKGRYSLSISCAQNKKGMAAKAALIEQFFTGGRVRKDMTLAQEKAHILAAIRRGKENASNMKYTISEHQNGLMYAYYKEQFWFWHKDQNKWVPSAFATQQYDKAKAKDSGITPEMLLDNGSFNVLEEYQVPLQRRTALEALTPADSQVPAPDDRAVTKATPAAAPASAEPPHPQPGDVYQAPQSGQFYKIDKFAAGKATCYRTMRKAPDSNVWEPANSSLYPNLSDAQGEFEAWIRTKQLKPVAPTGAAAATTAASAAPQPSQAAGTSTGSSGNSADASSCPSAEPVRQAPAALPLSAPDTAPTSLPAFNFGALDAETAEKLRGITDCVMEMYQTYAWGMAYQVGRAHDLLCGDSDRCETVLQRSENGQFAKKEKTFTAWCAYIGVERRSAYNLLNAYRLICKATPEQQRNLQLAPAKLLYEAGKKDVPDQLADAVMNGDITTHKQYQEALAEIRARDAKINDLLEMSEAADRRADKAEQAAKDTARERDAALRRATEAEARATTAENRSAGAQKLADQRGTENTELKAKIRELENQPRDVAVVQPGEEQIEAWRREGANRMAATMQETVRRANQERLNAQNQVADLQQQLATARPDADACQRTADILYETAENLRILLRTQLKQAQLSPTAYGKVVAHVLQVARTLLDTVRVCSPDGYDMDSEEDDDFE